MIDFDAATPHEIIMTFPARHPHTFRCVLYLAIFVAKSVPWEAVWELMRRMGYEYIDIGRVSEDGSATFSAPTWACPDDLRPE